MAEAFAPAKINLTLHVTGQRDDGYHLLDSLVVFADVGDRLVANAAAKTGLKVTGPMAGGVPTDERNLVLRAASMALPSKEGAAFELEKHLPAAAGIGGGSSDAAAALHLIAALTGRPLPATEQLLALGADVPACVLGRPCRARGIGEQLREVELPEFHLVLVNPGVAVPTAEVFRNLRQPDGAPMSDPLPAWSTAAELASWLHEQRNDLETPARKLAPVVGDVIGRLARVPACLLARMSGSGATCFGLFATREKADEAAQAIAAENPGWWVRSAGLWRR